MIHGFVFGVAPAFIVVGLVLRHGILRTIGNLIKIAAVVAVAAAVVVTPFYPPAVVVPIIALLWWAFFINPRERDSDPVWANVAGFVFCAGFAAVRGAARHRASAIPGAAADSGWAPDREAAAMITTILAAAVARHFPGADVDRITSEMLVKLKRHQVRLLQDGETLLAIAESLPEERGRVAEQINV